MSRWEKNVNNIYQKYWECKILSRDIFILKTIKQVIKNKIMGRRVKQWYKERPKSKKLLSEDHTIKWLKNKSYKIFGTTTRWQDLYNILEKQNFTCPYTGEKIIIGVNASIDHILPKSFGGSNDVSNLQWTIIDVNLMKGTHSHDGFMTLIKRIVKHTGLITDD